MRDEEKKLLQQLLELRDNEPRYRAGGICVNVDYPMQKLVEMMKGWPEHSGDLYHPVPHPEEEAHLAYARSADLWTGPYGEARKRLLDFLITKLEAGE